MQNLHILTVNKLYKIQVDLKQIDLRSAKLVLEVSKLTRLGSLKSTPTSTHRLYKLTLY